MVHLHLIFSGLETSISAPACREEKQDQARLYGELWRKGVERESLHRSRIIRSDEEPAGWNF
ncbi:MAG: hypothetical protein DMG13_21285 [Acidobacteria bacterium]|nr:MAG: hypothetical protein DMG13_21285 [Acidobacteriota bacterium]